MMQLQNYMNSWQKSILKDAIFLQILNKKMETIYNPIYLMLAKYDCTKWFQTESKE